MDKRNERTALDKIFGPYASEAQDSESPDFLIAHTGFAHGVEVTEIYPSPIDAKLQNLPSYTVSLLEDTAHLHRNDRGAVRVETVSLVHEDGRKVTDVRAIIQKSPTAKEKLDLLLEKIEEKSAKHPIYREQADFIDLVIWDRGSLFGREQDFQAITSASTDQRKKLLKMPFREVFVLTRSPEPSRFFYYPVRANLLLLDAILLDHLNLESGADIADPLRLPMLATCLSALGHSIAYQSEHEASIHTPGWQALFQGLEVKLRDWTNSTIAQPPFSRGMTVPVDRARADCLLAARDKIHCKNVVALPARR